MPTRTIMWPNDVLYVRNTYLQCGFKTLPGLSRNKETHEVCQNLSCEISLNMLMLAVQFVH